jgi:hypothetical protein
MAIYIFICALNLVLSASISNTIAILVFFEGRQHRLEHIAPRHLCASRTIASGQSQTLARGQTINDKSCDV